jgi:hypothetical protein
MNVASPGKKRAVVGTTSDRVPGEQGRSDCFTKDLAASGRDAPSGESEFLRTLR